MVEEYSMKRRLPSLQSLRAFDAASRTANFTQAAEELLLTQSAVSRHIKNLEADLGVALFYRAGKQMNLTEHGLRLRGIVNLAFDGLADGIHAMRTSTSRPSLTISMLPSLAAKWFVKWVGEYSALHPDIDLNIHCTRALVDFDRENVDAAIRYGRGKWAGCDAELLMKEDILVVCSPGLSERMGSNPQPDILIEMPLLFGDGPDNWDGWLRAAGQPGVKLPSGPAYTDGNAILQAAIDGQGVLLGRSVLVAGDIAAGRLVEPFNTRVPASYAYYFVKPRGKALSSILSDVKEFIFLKAGTQ